ncbi:Ig-like domain-containing protein [Planctomyces sp. SH-PL62]|uniref:Ig-like domain-containing protein n=1 Tax=Planctomyces sp. SH-PL62 TaxID=1636152 RepID=UPI00078B3D9D|nr:Ig-like domain-containing protein [Planctomyces sp. SH-PL62]AMV39418.1 hypothetical protein VT85_18415 [Planctomyces sp. SH-PL62]
MGSFKADSGDKGPDRRQGKKHAKRQGSPKLEYLEGRILLASDPLQGGNPIWNARSVDIGDVQNGPMAPLGGQLINLYQKQQSGLTSNALAAAFPALQIRNGSVLVGLTTWGDLNALQKTVKNLGMQVTSSSTTYGMINGWLPINQLYTTSQIPSLVSGRPIYKPEASYQGLANNQAQQSMFADAAATQYNVTGAGVTVGVLSDSFDSLGGYQTDVSTGDLPAGIRVLSDLPAGQGSDEGRAMLQNIYDIAPGATLQFATAFIDDLSYAQNIVALADAGSKVIVDDVGYANEPFFQDGIIAQSVTNVTQRGIPYFAAARNSADGGYLSSFRGVQATIPSINNGAAARFMNFNGGSGTAVTQMPITTASDGVSIIFQYDQPFATQQPVGTGNTVTSQLHFFVLDSSGAVVASGTDDNTATQQPFQFVTIPTAGTYSVVIQVVSGADPGHVQFVEWGGDVAVSQQFGTAGGTYYATSVGHSTAVDTIGVGATPWWAPSPFLNQNPLANEPFSSFGPSIYVRDARGALLSKSVVPQNPFITAPDGGNTTFFGGVMQTNNPPFPGNPATTTNLSQDLPSFFGTSSAAPNAAAVAALMFEKAPDATVAEIRAGLASSARPMNGAGAGVWHPQSGFGLIDAVAAVASVDVLQVASTTPANSTVVTTTPNYIIVTFSKPVRASSLSAGNIQFVRKPNGVTTSIGAPIPVDDPTNPTVVAYPYSFTYNKAVTNTANGVYSYVVAGPVTSTDGRVLEQSGLISFQLSDVTSPRVASTNTQGRLVTVKFSKPMNPATITKQNIIVARLNGAPNFSSPNIARPSLDPRVTIRYDAATNTATLDFSALPQTELPTDAYAIVVMGGAGGVTDAVGNQLDGEFSGSFPSGNGTAGGTFLQELGTLVVRAPVITSFALDPSSTNDTGIPSDSNTNKAQPKFIGQVFNTFPGSVANADYYVQFNSTNGGAFSLGVGPGGRGITGSYNVSGKTDANGAFTLTAHTALPEGFQRARVVVVGQNDQTSGSGLSSSLDRAFRIDLTRPSVTGAAQLDQSPFPFYVSDLPGLSLYVQDVSAQAAGYLATPRNVVFPALDPSTAVNLSNYQLQVTLDNGTTLDVSQYITKANYVGLTPTYDASGNFIGTYQGRIDLTLAPGLPAGTYRLRAFSQGTVDGVFRSGLLDAAGNPLLNGGSSTPNYALYFKLQRAPAYITNMVMASAPSPNAYYSVGGPGAYFDLSGGRAQAPPKAWMLDFSNPLPFSNGSGAAIDYSAMIQLVRSANSAGAPADGNFGDLGQDGKGSSGSGFTRVAGTIAELYWQNPATGGWIKSDASHPHGTRIVLLSPGGLPDADYYRVYVPNQVDVSGNDSRIFDIYRNQLDGEFLGNPTSTVSTQFHPFSPDPSKLFPGDRAIYNYETLLTTGYTSPAPVSRMTGDGVDGGAFMAGFVVATSNHILYTRPDYREDPFDPSTAPDGSLAKPYSALAPEAAPGSDLNPGRDPNGGLNSASNFLSGFNPNYDRNGNGRFDRSVLYAAQQLAYTGPVVIVAIPGTPQRDPLTGVVTQLPFVLQAPAGSNSYNNGSASVPFNTTLVFTPGTTLKSQNASLFVQNQGSALQIQGNSIPGQQVNFTSYNDASIGGPTNGNPNTTPRAGDWGGVVFRNYNQSVDTRANDVRFPVDGILLGVGAASADPARPALAGADELMSRINFATFRYGGGAVPRSSGTTYSGITLYNTRPSITNTRVTDTGTSGGTQGAIGADMDSFLQDDVARGPVIRRVTVQNNSLNGIWMLAQNNGFIEPTDATRLANPITDQVRPANYALFQPLPLIVLAQLIVGQQFQVNSGGSTRWVGDRLYVDSGSMLRFGRNSSLSVLNPQSSLNVGSRDYMSKFDRNSNYSPESDNFKALNANDPQVLFTSLFDNTATTTLVPTPINVTGNTTPVTLGPAMWGSVGIQSGARAVINAATFRYGGGEVNTTNITMPSQSVLSFITDQTTFSTPFTFGQGTRVYVTNNNFYNNFDAAMQVEPDGLLAGDPLRPLISGHPFLRGNVMQGNGIDGLAVLATRSYLSNASSNYAVVGPIEASLLPFSSGNQFVHAVWDLTDITYVLRGTIVLAGTSRPVANPSAFVTPPGPNTSLTIQSALPNTLLADGTRIASPGASVVVKLLTENNTNGAGDLEGTFGSTGAAASLQGGAGFIAGVDDGADPDASPLIDPGVWSQIRILGIPGNQSTGQKRVPVIITSLRDTTVGTTARGVVNNTILNSYPVGPYTRYAGQSLSTPAAGDGGYIYIGGNSSTTFNLDDPRQGSLIDNADLRFMTRIEVEGGGIVSAGPGSPLENKAGYVDPSVQLNARMALRISASNIDSFADAAVFAHPGAANAIVGFERSDFRGQGVTLYLYNNTISNTPVGVRVNSETVNNDPSPSPMILVALNNTFYNTGTGIRTQSPIHDGTNSQSHVYTMAMNNIFVNSSDVAVNLQGMQWNSQLQNNLFFGNNQNVLSEGNSGAFQGNISPRYGDPKFVDAANRNFALSAGSQAIDAGRSEIGPNPAGNAVYPIVTPPASGLSYGPRTDPANLTGNQQAGASNVRGGLGGIFDTRQILTLPGSGAYSFPDLFVPTLTLPAGATNGPSYVTGSLKYEALGNQFLGRRDLLGFIRADEPTTPDAGTGFDPFTDIGAFEYVNLHPPTVTAVTAIYAGAAGVWETKNFYAVGGTAGSNRTPDYVQFNFDSPIDPNSVNADTVKLQAQGKTGNNVPGTYISLAGLLSYDVANRFVRVKLAAAGIDLKTDAYRFVLVGEGANVLANPQGIALDGENLTNNNNPATGVQLPLPSGNGNPGGDFYSNFIINTVASGILPGSFVLSPASDSNVVGDRVTNVVNPTFTGTITNPNTALVPLAGQTAVVDIGVVSMTGNGNTTTYWTAASAPANLAAFVRPNAGTGLTSNTGAFAVTVGQDAAGSGLVTNTAGLLSSPYNVGSSGNLIPIPGTVGGYYVARVRIIDQSGNVSNNTIPAAQTTLVVDNGVPTSAGTPLVVKIDSPTNGSVVSNPTSDFGFQISANKNLDLTHLTTSQIQLVRAGADGTFASGTSITIDPASMLVRFLDSAAEGGGGGKGRELVTFKPSTSLGNGLYQLTILGTGANGIRDIAGNLPGADLTIQFAVYSPSTAHSVFVGAAFATDPSATLGSRANPYSTIADAVSAAGFGDRVAVLPGIYYESVVMRNQISLVSASSSSTDASLVPGNALKTIIRPAAAANAISVTATGLTAFTDPTTGATLQTELTGFTIASSLLGDPAFGSTNQNSIGLLLTNSTMLVGQNYFINSGIGVLANTSSSAPGTSSFVNNGFIGNTTGVYLNDQGGTPTSSTHYLVNNTFAFNTTGLWAQNSGTTGSNQAYVANNIFWQNHDQTPARGGLGIYSATPSHLILNNNLFSGNGQSDSLHWWAAYNAGNGFDLTKLGRTPATPPPTSATSRAGPHSSRRSTPAPARTARPPST